MALPRLIPLVLLSAASAAMGQEAADAYFDSERMAEARAALYAGHGAQTNYLMMFDRLEWLDTDDDAAGVWDVQGWLGGDIHRFWLKSEGEIESGDVQEGELQMLYGKAISPFFDLQFGVRHDLEPEGLTHGVVALQGLAPQWFEADVSGFLSEKGDLTGRLELEYDALLTQRLVLQPRMELAVSAQDVPELGLGSGVTDAKLGIRLRYEVVREVAPYLGIEWRSAYGGTADALRMADEPVSDTSIVVGLRIWY